MSLFKEKLAADKALAREYDRVQSKLIMGSSLPNFCKKSLANRRLNKCHIKTRVDSERGRNGIFIITGSQNFLLMENLAESPAGRAAVIPFLGPSATEWRTTAGDGSLPEWKNFLWRGGFPALWSAPQAPPSRDRWYQGYVATYLERDVRNLLNVGSLRDFERFLRACAARCGQVLNLSELGRDVGVSTPTAKQWLSVLQASNQVFLLEPYHRSLGKRISKTPKLYFTDGGLAAYLVGGCLGGCSVVVARGRCLLGESCRLPVAEVA